MKHLDALIVGIAAVLIFGGLIPVIIGMNVQSINLKILGLIIIGLIFPYMYFIPKLYRRFGEPSLTEVAEQ